MAKKETAKNIPTTTNTNGIPCPFEKDTSHYTQGICIDGANYKSFGGYGPNKKVSSPLKDKAGK